MNSRSKMAITWILFSCSLCIGVVRVLAGGDGRSCPKYEHYEECAQSPCQTTCETFGQRCNIINKKCSSGCYCDEGYARDANYTCIRDNLFECERLKPGKCKERPNEVFACGSACQNECRTFGQPCQIINKKCNELCYCKEGYARDDKKICIPENSPDCNLLKPTCSFDQVKKCGLPCGSMCSTRRAFCPRQICVDGCYCKDGYLFDQQKKCIPIDSNECVTISKPEKDCGNNEIWDCTFDCQRFCNTESDPNCQVLSLNCVGDCFCVEGYAKNATGACIPEDSRECENLKPCI